MAGRGGGRRGRGQYYKEKYGGRKREYDGTDTQIEDDEQDYDEDFGGTSLPSPIRGSSDQLAAKLARLDSKGFKAYRDIKGAWQLSEHVTLFIDNVQSDPYAAPSRMRVKVENPVANFSPEFWGTTIRRIALCDYLGRSMSMALRRSGADVRNFGNWSGAKGGNMSINHGNQHILERSSVVVNHQGDIEARITVAMPGRGRTTMGKHAAYQLCTCLPKYVRQGLYAESQNTEAMLEHIQCAENTEHLRSALPEHGLVGFVGNGAILPRVSGACEEPMRTGAVPFVSPPSQEVTINLPSGMVVKGMGIKKGVTLIVGGGFHGKTTMLKALEAGHTNKIPGDGREFVVTVPDACKIRAEDGRRVEGVNISPFISNLPMGKGTDFFATDDASGSTSQAADIMEALEVGSKLLLIDEDTTATNFMIRDARMQALVSPDKEPITPLVAKIRALLNIGVSVILVIGGSGSYFEVADTVLAMDCFKASDVTQEAHRIAATAGGGSLQQKAEFGAITQRIPEYIIDDGGPRGLKFRWNLDSIRIGYENIDLKCIEQLFDESQCLAVACCIKLLAKLIKMPDWEGETLSELLNAIQERIDAEGLDCLSGSRERGQLARPRSIEIAAAFNRLRTIKVRQGEQHMENGGQ